MSLNQKRPDLFKGLSQSSLFISPVLIVVYFLILQPVLVPWFAEWVNAFVLWFIPEVTPKLIAHGNDFHLSTRVAWPHYDPNNPQGLTVVAPGITVALISLPMTWIVMVSVNHRRIFNLVVGTLLISISTVTLMATNVLVKFYSSMATDVEQVIVAANGSPVALSIVMPIWLAGIKPLMGVVSYANLFLLPVLMGWLFNYRYWQKVNSPR